ncbi:type II toxin-antitoxin system PemK/MazF family toxin [Fortiea sp. LEGE XX443]|nr:type II toxin-antitoxin system PemK/MazF family toxin [Fortiea sp. LEGE XX443]
MSPIRYNQISSLVLTCPISSNSKGLSFEVLLYEGLITQGVVLADQIKTLDCKKRRVRFVEKVSEELVE